MIYFIRLSKLIYYMYFNNLYFLIIFISFLIYLLSGDFVITAMIL